METLNKSEHAALNLARDIRFRLDQHVKDLTAGESEMERLLARSFCRFVTQSSQFTLIRALVPEACFVGLDEGCHPDKLQARAYALLKSVSGNNRFGGKASGASAELLSIKETLQSLAAEVASLKGQDGSKS